MHCCVTPYRSQTPIPAIRLCCDAVCGPDRPASDVQGSPRYEATTEGPRIAVTAQDDRYFCQERSLEEACVAGPLSPQNESAALALLLSEAGTSGELRDRISRASQQHGEEGAGSDLGSVPADSAPLCEWFVEQGGATQLTPAMFPGLRGAAATGSSPAGRASNIACAWLNLGVPQTA